MTIAIPPGCLRQPNESGWCQCPACHIAGVSIGTGIGPFLSQPRPEVATTREQLYYVYDAGHRWGPPDLFWMHACPITGQSREVPPELKWPPKRQDEIRAELQNMKNRRWYTREYLKKAGEDGRASSIVDATMALTSADAAIRALEWVLGETKDPT